LYYGIATVFIVICEAITKAIAYEKNWIRNRWNMGAIWSRFLCNMGTVLVLHFILFMQHKNRPHVSMFH